MKQLPPADEERAVMKADETIEVSNSQIARRAPIDITIERDGILTPIDGSFQFITAESHYRASFAKKKAQVMASIETVMADAFHAHNNYHYASIHAINNAVRAGCAEYGIALSVRRSGEIARVELDGRKQDLWRQHFVFTLTDAETGYYEETEVPGLCEDKTGSGAFTKCLRAAQKDFMVSTFMISIDSSPRKEGVDEMKELIKSMDRLRTYLEKSDEANITQRFKEGRRIVEDKWALQMRRFAFDLIELLFLRHEIASAVFLIGNDDRAGLDQWVKRLTPKVKEWFGSHDAT